ncbi:ABC transporter ATP-binding protein [Candidatus Epulonipiscioides gigas]|nr:ABC transporter ATP-binding protein [Epulopiscium sp. SCG-C07WGA-EpuloA2]ONI44839.1 ABC transporter ATP-binding protein [Epulopiscium sp. SCG-C07WGA-EpuloA2]
MTEFILEMKNITKSFSGVKALDNVNLQVKKGHIHALVGENGAGKSTLMNVLSGVYSYGSYTGDILYDGKICKFSKIPDSESKGIVIIHQELALIQELTIGENMFLGNERGKKFAIDWNLTYAEADKYLKTVGLLDSSRTRICDIGVGKQQLVEIAKALAKNAKLLILDEPTSSLNEQDSQALLDLLLEFKAQGMTCIIITHKLNEVSYVADEITIIRDGKSVETLTKGVDECTEDRIISAMVGRELSDRFPKRTGHTISDEIAMEVANWTVHHPIYTERKVVDNVSFHVKKGEVVGFSGLMGAGRTELAMSIFGKSYGTAISGSLKINGKEKELGNIRQAIDMGLAYVTEDRKGNGLILTNPIRTNTTLANLAGISKNTIIAANKEYEIATNYAKKMHTKCTSIEQLVGNLSGGNQQKVLLSKWMFSNPNVLILDEPTRGIDVGAKYEIYTIINELIQSGKSVIMISSELPEVLGMSDRIYVMNEGKIVGEFAQQEATQEGIMSAILKSDKGGSEDGK